MLVVAVALGSCPVHRACTGWCAAQTNFPGMCCNLAVGLYFGGGEEPPRCLTVSGLCLASSVYPDSAGFNLVMTMSLTSLEPMWMCAESAGVLSCVSGLCVSC